MHDIGHDIAGGEHDRAGLDLVPIGQSDADRAPGRIERDRFGVEQPRAARDSDTEQPARQLHRIGIGGPRRDDRAGARNAKRLQQPGMVEKITGQARTLAQLMLLDQFAPVSPAARYSESLSRMSQAMPSCSTSDFRPVTALQAGAIGARGRSKP